MTFYVGTDKVKGVYVGSDEVKKIYIGTDLVWEKDDSILYEPAFDGSETYTILSEQSSFSEPLVTIGDGIFETKGAYLNDYWLGSNDFLLTGEVYLNESADNGGLLFKAEDSEGTLSDLFEITYYHSRVFNPRTSDNYKGFNSYKTWKSFSVRKVGTSITIQTPTGTLTATRDWSNYKIHVCTRQWTNNGSTTKLRNIKVERI